MYRFLVFLLFAFLAPGALAGVPPIPPPAPIPSRPVAVALSKLVNAAQSNNVQVNQPMSIPAWSASTTYFTGERVSNNGLYFEEMFGVSCVSAGSGGPTTAGSFIADNTCLWNSVSATPTGNAPTITVGLQWAVNTTFPAGATAVTYSGSGASALGYFYTNTGACTSASSGFGPTGTSSGQTDGTCTWNYNFNRPTAIYSNASAHSFLFYGTSGLATSAITTSSPTFTLASCPSGTIAGAWVLDGTSGKMIGKFASCASETVTLTANANNSASIGDTIYFTGNLTTNASFNGGTPYVSPSTGYANILGPTVVSVQGFSPARVEFTTSAPVLVIRTFAIGIASSGYGIRVTVCGPNHDNCQLVSPNISGPTVIDWVRYVVDFTSVGGRSPRDITIETNDVFGGVDVAVGDDLFPPGGPATLTMGTMGDSYPAGAGTIGASWAFPKVAADMLGIRGWVSTAIGGCGYLPSTCTSGSALSRIGDIFQINGQLGPDVLLMSNGNDDIANGTAATIAAAQTTYIQAVRAILPNTLIVTLGPYNRDNPGNSQAVALDVAEQAAAAAMGDPLVVYCPWVNDPQGSWETGTGSISAQNGTGNTDFTFETVVLHENFYGNRVYAARIVKCVRQWLSANGY